MMSAPLLNRAIMVMCVISATMTGCGITDAGRPFPPTELLWSRAGFHRVDVDFEMMNCSQRLNLHPELKTYVQQTNVVDLCMLQKGFTFVPRPNGWMNVCGPGGFPETVGCKSDRGEIVVAPDETALSVKPSNQQPIQSISNRKILSSSAPQLTTSEQVLRHPSR